MGSRYRIRREKEADLSAEQRPQPGDSVGFQDNTDTTGGAGSFAPSESACASPPERTSKQYGLQRLPRDRAEQLDRHESRFGFERVSRWIDEGMPVATMGKPRDMAAFRERQAERPEAVPTDVERQNARSRERNANAGRADPQTGEMAAPDLVRQVVSSPGRQMSEQVQREMESKMGGDFSGVQLHTGPRAAAAAESINARAFTVGNHVAFNRGEYSPETSDGKRILAHELTHVRQQTGAVSMLPKADGASPLGGDSGEFHVQPTLEVTPPDDPAEKEAEAVAEAVVDMEEKSPASAETASSTSVSGTIDSSAVNRQETSENEFCSPADLKTEVDFGPPAIDSEPTSGRVNQLYDWLDRHIAHNQDADTTYEFYEQIDQYLGPWGEEGYPIGYGKKYNIEFNDNDLLMENDVTSEWLREVEIGLQEELRDYIVEQYERGRLPEVEEGEIRQFAFDSHPDVYTEAGLRDVVLEAPHLVPTIGLIPYEEFNPLDEDFDNTRRQVVATAIILADEQGEDVGEALWEIQQLHEAGEIPWSLLAEQAGEDLTSVGQEAGEGAAELQRLHEQGDIPWDLIRQQARDDITEAIPFL